MKPLIIITLLFFALPVKATTYFVDNCVTVGSDSNNGTSTATPWLTLGKVNGLTFNPGDSILFRSTCTFRGNLFPTSSGTLGSPITFGAYGTGAIPIISGAQLMNSGWTNAGGNVWQVSLTTQPNQVFFNGTFGTIEGSTGAITAPNEWHWGGNVLSVYSTSNPATAFTSPGVEASVTTSLLTYNASLSYVTYTNLQAQYANLFGVYIAGSNANPGIVIGPGVVATYNWTEGIELSGLTSPVITQTTATHNGFNGMDMSNGTTNGLFDKVTAEYNCSQINGGANNFCAGVKTFNAPGTTTAQYSISCFNGLGIPNPATNIMGEGIWFDTNGSGSVIKYNLVCGNNLGGIDEDVSGGYAIFGNVVYGNDVSGATGQWESAGIIINTDAGASITGTVIYNNTVATNGNTGIVLIGPQPPVAGGCTNMLVKNNIVQGTVAGPALAAEYGCENPGTNGSGNVYTYNGLDVATSSFIEWGISTFYSTYAAWENASGSCGSTGCSHSMQSNPQFTNASAGNFTLTAGSPAIDAGTNLGSTYQFSLAPASTWPSNVTLANQNAYGTGWDIGAFVFTSGVINGTIIGPGVTVGPGVTIQ